MKYFSSQPGFSLVETLVAISILLLVITGPMTMIARSNQSTAFASEQIVAFFLAQEGLELAQMGRDSLLLADFREQIQGTAAPDPWARFLSTSASTFGDCFASTCGLTIADSGATVAVKNCTATGGCRLYTDTASARSVYVHTGSVTSTQTATPYTRNIKMERIPAAGKVREIKVTSTVTWRTGSLIAGQQVQLVTYITNVYDTN